MKRAFWKMKGIGFIAWNGRHYMYHLLVGLVWAWFLRERWNEFNTRYISYALIGSLLPDLDHLLYFLYYGKRETYTQSVLGYIKSHQWRNLTLFLKNGHKYNTNLSYHNIYTVAFFLILSYISSFIEWRVGVVLFGAMMLHYIFDIIDDFLVLGYVNSNWKRWGRGERRYPL